MDDLISRQAAIDEIKAVYEWHDMPTEERMIQHFKVLPSAQPEIVRCKDCRHNQSCDIQYHAQAGDMFFCAGAERRTYERSD